MADSTPAAYDEAAAQVLAPSISERARPDARLIALWSLGHFVIDLNQGSLPAILPFIKSTHAQQYLPRNAGMATGLIVGFAFGTAGLGVTFLGWLADRHGLMAALWISALMPLAGFVAASFLPAPRSRA